MRENVGHVTVCGTVDNDLEDSVVINVSSSLMGEDPTTIQRTFTTDSREQCFNITIPNDGIFEDNSTFTVMVTSDQPRVTIVNGSIEIYIQDDDGIHAIIIIYLLQYHNNITCNYIVKANSDCILPYYYSLSEHWSYICMYWGCVEDGQSAYHSQLL